jgi:hypothetical protein
MTARRTDGNHAEIRDALRGVGASVYDTHDLGHGFPDLLVVRPDTFMFLVEVKSSHGAKLTPDEKEFMTRCPAHVHIVYSVEDALRLYSELGWMKVR